MHSLSDILFNCIGFVVGIITNALFSSGIKKRTKAIVCSICYAAGIISYITLKWPSTSGSEESGFLVHLFEHFWVAILILAICIITTIYLIFGTETVNRRKISKILINETKKASRKQPLRIIAGDLDFLGDLTVDDISDTRRHILELQCAIPFIRNRAYPELNKHFQYNEQWHQLNDDKFEKIEIICRRPREKRDRLMIGLIATTLPSTSIKFYGTPSLQCTDCTNKDTCEICITCLRCQKKTCNKKRNSCDQLLGTKIDLCKFQDLDIRGRLFKNRENALRVDIFSKTSSVHKYINNLFTANDYEASFYDRLWETWWNSCRKEETVIKECGAEYSEYMTNRTKSQSDHN